MPLREPVRFSAARDFLAAKRVLPLELGTQDIALKVPERYRRQAFFSAKVASGHVLDALLAEVQSLAAGETDYTSARARMKTFLRDQGYGIPRPGDGEDADVQELPSTRRLDLILRQNVAMAHAIGSREVSEHPAVVEAFPCYRYVANTDRHERFDGLVLLKSDPFWRRGYPPVDFGCQCMALDDEGPPNGRTAFLDAERPAVGRVEFRGRMESVEGNQSGFEFASSPGEAFEESPPLESIEGEEVREAVRAVIGRWLAGEPNNGGEA